ncbi:MAG: ParB/RepB/Spo0J family partition protein [Clostridia bacterium]|nr:ParB/RepB/Spo0J family partition protein [Clostridia bacterium]
MARGKGLGRGLDAIFSDNAIESAAAGVTELRISDVEPKKDQPRKVFDQAALSELADSIASNGVIQPILVREAENGMYTIVAGERRWRASKMAGLSEIPAIVMDVDELTASKIAMIENLQREDLNPYEEAMGYEELIRKYSLTQEEVASQIGKSRAAVANRLRLLDLPGEVLEMLTRREITAGHGIALLMLKDRDDVIPMAKRISQKNMSVRDAEAAVKRRNAAAKEKEEPEDAGEKVDYIGDLEKKVTEILGRRCRISRGPGKRVITLDYTDLDDLEAILTKICGRSPIVD